MHVSVFHLNGEYDHSARIVCQLYCDVYLLNYLLNRIMVLNSVRQHNCFIIQGSYIGYMFRLIDQSSSGLFSKLSHKVLCTLCDLTCYIGTTVLLYVTCFDLLISHLQVYLAS